MARLGDSAKVRAASLIEVTVALIIIVAVLGVSLIIHLNVISKGTTLQKLKYGMFLEDYASRIKLEKSFIDEKIEFEEVIIQKEIVPYDGNNKLLFLHLKAFLKEDNQLMGQYRELIYVTNEEN